VNGIRSRAAHWRLCLPSSARGTLSLLVVLPDGKPHAHSRQLDGLDGERPRKPPRNPGSNIAIPVSHRWQICFTHEGSWTLSSVAV